MQAVNTVAAVLCFVSLFGCSRMEAPPPSPPRAVAAPPVATAAAIDEDVDEHPGEPRPVDTAAAPRRAALVAAGGPTPYFGLLHSHTLISDGSGTPEEAFERAKSKGLDFFAITEHNHAEAEGTKPGPRRDGVLIATTPDLYSGSSPVTVTRKWKTSGGNDASETLTITPLIPAAAQASDASFVALYGQEFSSISKGNHVNVLGIDEVLTVDNGDFKSLYEELSSLDPLPVVQMNHPGIHADLFSSSTKPKEVDNDYGYDDYGKDFAAFVAAADPLLVLIEVLSGPALDTKSYSNFIYRDNEDDYFFYLSQGFHISPSAGHDDHFRHWGTKTPARMGVFATSLSQDALVKAMRANRTYATEDDNIVIRFSCNGAFMGSVLTVPSGTSVDCKVEVFDPGEPNASYEVDFVRGQVSPQVIGTLEELKLEDGIVESWTRDGNGDVPFSAVVSSGQPEFFLARVRQDGAERAWSAPVWVNHPRSYSVE